jgi:PAS domain S-box-containing protein
MAVVTARNVRPADVSPGRRASEGNVSLAFGASAARALHFAPGVAAPVRTTDELLGLLHPEDRAGFAALLAWVRQQAGESARLWCRLARADGEWIHVLARIRAAGGRVTIEVELDDAASARRAEAQIRQILEEAGLVAVVDCGGEIVYANSALARMLGYASLIELRAMGAQDHVHPGDREMVAARREARLAGRNAPDSYEFRMVRKDGSSFWVDCHTSLVTWNGRPASLAWLIDVTDRKRMQEALSRTEKLFGAIFDSSPAMLALSRADDGRFIEVNRAFLRGLGYRREELLGRTEREVGILLDAEAGRRICRGSADEEIIAAVKTRSGEVRQFAFSSQPIRVADLDMLLTVAHDVTARLQHEEELRESKRAAELANRAKSEFLAHMSHELRTPLNAIIGFSDIIAEQIYGPVTVPKYLEYARDVRGSGEHLLQIINDLLDLSKLEAGKQELHESVFVIEAVVERAMRLVQGRATTAGLAIAVEIEPGLPRVRADERLMIQMLTNLLSNAVKFTPPGGSVTVRAGIGAEGTFQLAVQDTGVGMTPEGIEVALTPFGQVENAFARQHQGTGLGLPLVRALADLHGGNLRVESELGRGTTVTIELPAERLVGG